LDTLVDSEAAYRVALLAAGIDPAGSDYRRARERVKSPLDRDLRGGRRREGDALALLRQS
jgi:hypothetical protein